MKNDYIKMFNEEFDDMFRELVKAADEGIASKNATADVAYRVVFETFKQVVRINAMSALENTMDGTPVTNDIVRSAIESFIIVMFMKWFGGSDEKK